MIDLRSDTATLPTPQMREAMHHAKLGDATLGEDPEVNKLEVFAAKMLGKEAALFVSSGTQSNLLALLTHCQRGDEYICGQDMHCYKYEGGGAAVLGSIQPQPLAMDTDGTINLDHVNAAIKPEADDHYAKTRLFCLENTINGKALPLSYLHKARTFCNQHKLKMHLDGARLFNAALASNVPAKDIAAPFDSLSLCLSKSLGAPVGSLLLGSQNFIQEAKRWRKMLGGGMRQAGTLAAAGHYALTHHIDRLAEDHNKAKHLAERLSKHPELEISTGSVQTNMVFIKEPAAGAQALCAFLKNNNILASPRYDKLRLVLHLDIQDEDIEIIGNAFDLFFNQGAQGHTP